MTVEARVRRAARAARDRHRRATASTGCRRCRPGDYTVTFTLVRHADRDAEGAGPAVDRTPSSTRSSASQGVTETVTVTATATLDRQGVGVDQERRSRTSRSAACRSAQEYRDLIKLIPAVQFTQDQTRGPSAGGSGQDNVYQFDGVNVTLPLFGTLSAEPASHDIAQITVIKGGARAVDFDRVRRLLDRLGQQVGHEPLRRPVQLSVPDRRTWRPTSRTAAQSRLPAGPQLARRQRRRADPQGQAVLLRLVLPARRTPRNNAREPLRRAARRTTARATKGSAS